MINSPLVSVVVPTYNRKKSVERLIQSILKSTYKKIEIIIIDDFSKDLTSEYLMSKYKDNPKLHIYRNKKNLYTAGSRNEGQKKSKGEFIFFIDDDNVLDRYAIEYLVREFLKNSKLGAAGLVNYDFNDKKKVLWILTKRNMATTKTYQPRDLRAVSGKKIWNTADIPNAFMVRRDIVLKNKISFKKEFGIMYEESDYAYRIRQAGYLVCVIGNAKIYHDIETSEDGKKTQDYMFHFMNDKRRPFVFARNRILFHNLYSSRLQLFVILTFWIWFFAGYYVYRILFYDGYGSFSLISRLNLCLQYISGLLNGLGQVILKKYEQVQI